MPCFFTLPKIHLQAKLENCEAAPPGFEPEPYAYLADALTTALWCSCHPQRRKHDISSTYLHLLANHTTSRIKRSITDFSPLTVTWVTADALARVLVAVHVML